MLSSDRCSLALAVGARGMFLVFVISVRHAVNFIFNLDLFLTFWVLDSRDAKMDG